MYYIRTSTRSVIFRYRYLHILCSYLTTPEVTFALELEITLTLYPTFRSESCFGTKGGEIVCSSPSPEVAERLELTRTHGEKRGHKLSRRREHVDRLLAAETAKPSRGRTQLRVLRPGDRTPPQADEIGAAL